MPSQSIRRYGHGLGAMAAVILAASILWQCASIQDMPRTKLRPGEGKYEYSEKIKLTRDTLYRRIEQWVAVNEATFQEVKRIQKNNTKIIQVKALAPLKLFGRQRHLTYTLMLRALPGKVHAVFMTGSMSDGFYPPENVMPQLQQHYEKKFASLLAAIKPAVSVAP